MLWQRKPEVLRENPVSLVQVFSEYIGFPLSLSLTNTACNHMLLLPEEQQGNPQKEVFFGISGSMDRKVIPFFFSPFSPIGSCWYPGVGLHEYDKELPNSLKQGLSLGHLSVCQLIKKDCAVGLD